MNLRLAAPGLLLAGVILIPFLSKPFTIDDPLFLRAAEHAWTDPLHPADFEQVWNTGERQKLSEYLLGGTLPAYLLAPVAAAGGREWMAHLYQLLWFFVLLIAGVALAVRLGCDAGQARTAALLMASNPVALAMAATCMPDVTASALAVLALERLLAFREKPGLSRGLIVGVLLAAALLCRASTAAVFAVSALWLWRPPTQRAARFWPLALAGVLVLAFLSLNRSSGGQGVGSAFRQLTSLSNLPRNTIAFLCYQALTGPLLVYALVVRGRKFLGLAALLLALGLALASLHISANLDQYAVPAALGICLGIAVAGVAWEVPASLALTLWMGSGMVALPYVQMAAKYLLPGVPAAALLVVQHSAGLTPARRRLAMGLLVTLGCLSGILIILGDAALASSQRSVVERWIAPRIAAGDRVWAGGQWAFLGYAQKAGAEALANTAPFPRPGDYIVVSRLDYYGKLEQLPLSHERLASESDRRCGVFVLNRPLSAGFYSIRFGYLPFAVGCAELNRYDLFRVQ